MGNTGNPGAIIQALYRSAIRELGIWATPAAEISTLTVL